MVKADAIKIAKRYIESISKKYQLENVYLFGSFAKGTNNADSDIDLAIILKNVDDIFQTQVELLCLRGDDDLLIEPHPFNRNDFEKSNPLVAEIMKNGISLFNNAA